MISNVNGQMNVGSGASQATFGGDDGVYPPADLINDWEAEVAGEPAKK